MGISWKLSVPGYAHAKAGLWANFASPPALALASNWNQAPLPRPVPTEVVAPGAGPRDPPRADGEPRLALAETPGQLGTGQHTGQIGSPCLQDPQPQALMSHPLSQNLHLHVHLYLLGLWQENPRQRRSHRLGRESLPWLPRNTQTPTMTHPPLQEERAPALDRDPEPLPETPRPGERSALQPPSLSAHRGRRQLGLPPGDMEFLSPELLCIWFVSTFLVMFYFLYGFLYFCWLSWD